MGKVTLGLSADGQRRLIVRRQPRLRRLRYGGPLHLRRQCVRHLVSIESESHDRSDRRAHCRPTGRRRPPIPARSEHAQTRPHRRLRINCRRSRSLGFDRSGAQTVIGTSTRAIPHGSGAGDDGERETRGSARFAGHRDGDDGQSAERVAAHALFDSRCAAIGGEDGDQPTSSQSATEGNVGLATRCDQAPCRLGRALGHHRRSTAASPSAAPATRAACRRGCSSMLVVYGLRDFERCPNSPVVEPGPGSGA